MSNDKYVLAEVEDLSPLFLPLKTSNRIKYTCFNVSQNFVVFGATSGGLYVFKRESSTFLQLLPNKEGCLTHVAISPNEKLIAFSTTRGTVCVLDRNESGGSRRIITSSEHLGSIVTALKWNSSSNELYVGDELGRVSVITLSFYTAKTVFQMPALTLMQLDSSIVQIDWFEEILLVSTLSRCFLCDTVREQYRQIGVKLREGEYGACFYTTKEYRPALASESQVISFAGAFKSMTEVEPSQIHDQLEHVKIFCARPGSRLWEVNINGTVVCTHQFKEALAVSPTKAIKLQHGVNSENEFTGGTSCVGTWNQQSFNFAKLLVIAKRFLFTFKSDGIYVFDPEKAVLVLWNNEYKNIIDAKVFKDTIYIWTASGEMHSLALSLLEKVLVKLYLKESYLLCAKLCDFYKDYLMERAESSLKLSLLRELGSKIRDPELLEKISPILNEIKKCSNDKKHVSRLKSGIFIVENSHFVQRTIGEEFRCDHDTLHAPNNELEKSRSLEASPNFSRRLKRSDKRSISGGSSPFGSAVSLPELAQASTEKTGLDVNNGKENSFTEIPNSSIIFPVTPTDTIQTLKEISQSVSGKLASGTKILKEKLHVLEKKVRHLSVEDRLDYRTSIHVPASAEIQRRALVDDHSETESEIVHVDSSRVNKISKLPNIDLSEIIEFSKELEDHEGEGAILFSEKIVKMLLKIFNEFQTGINMKKIQNGLSKNIGAISTDDTDSAKVNAEDAIRSFSLSEKEVDDGSTTNDLVNDTDFLKCVHDGSVGHKFLSEKSSQMTVFPFSFYFSGETIIILKDALIIFLKSESLPSLIQNMNELQILYTIPLCLENIHQDSCLRLDAFLGTLFTLCAELLDPNEFLIYIKSLNLPCYYASLCSVLNSQSQFRKENDSDTDTILHRMNTVYMMLTLGKVDICSKFLNCVTLKDVYYLILRMEENLIKEGEDAVSAKLKSQHLFLSYLTKCNEDVLESALSDHHMNMAVTSVFEDVNRATTFSCVCGYPVSIPPAPNFQDIGRHILNRLVMQNNTTALQKFLHKVPGMWKLYLDHLVATQGTEMKDVICLAIHLCDLPSVEKYLPATKSEDLDYMLNLVVKYNSGKCLNCSNHINCKPVNWSEVGVLLVKCLGPREAVSLLMKHADSINPGDLNIMFFKSCMFSGIIDTYAAGLRDEVVDLLQAGSDKIDSTSVFSSKIGEALENSLEKDLGTVAENMKSLLKHAEKHYWGSLVDLKDGLCPYCALPLNSQVLIKEGGLTVFRCGHSYHLVCAQQNKHYCCLLCQRDSIA